MKVSFITFTLSFLIIFTSSNYAQWEQTNGPNGINVAQMVKTGSFIYVSTPGNLIFVSTNSGSSWVSTASQLPEAVHIRCIAAKGDSIFAGTQDYTLGLQGGIYFSSDRGTSWSFVLPMTTYQVTGGILINGSQIIAPGANSHGNCVYLSSNFGSTWDTIVPANGVGSAMIAEGNTIFAGSGGRMSVSTDNGFSWSQLPNSPYYVAAVIIKNNVIYADSWNDGVFKSTDNGNTWQPAGNGIPSNRRITSFAVIGNNLYASSYVLNYRLGGIYETTDDGNSWSSIGLDIFQLSGLCSEGSNLLTSFFGGVFLSTNDGVNWITSNSGFPYRDVNLLCPSDNRMFAGAGSLYYTTNHGDYWVVSNYTWGSVLSLASDGNRVVVGGHLTLSVSTDNGDSFSLIGGGFVGAPDCLAAGILGNSILEGNHWTTNYSYALCLTTNSGGNWSLYTCPVSTTVRGFAISSLIIYAATNTGVYSSADSGHTWSQINSGLPTPDILSIAVGGGIIAAGTNGSGPYISTNNGLNWIPANSGISNSSPFSLIIKGNTIFAGLNSPARNKIYYSVNRGVSWFQLDDNLPSYPITALAADSSYLYASTGFHAGIWRRTLSEITGVQPTANNIPEQFALYQNYPNPFNPSTKISYDLSSEVNVSLVVYDVLGREVKTLVNEKQNAGNYKIDIDASNLPSGVYYYKLETNVGNGSGFTQTKKMVLLK